MNSGKIIFSKNPVYESGYKVEDPWQTVNSFLALKLEHYGFISLEDNLSKKLMEKKKIPILNSSIEEETQFSVIGNRLENMDFHLDSVVNKINSGENVWISINLLPEFLKVVDKFEGVEINIMDSYKNDSKDKFNRESLSFLLGLFGKFYGRKMTKTTSVKFGISQDKLYEGKDLEVNLVEELIQAVKAEKEASTFNLPPVNVFNKLIESLLIYKKILSK